MCHPTTIREGLHTHLEALGSPYHTICSCTIWHNRTTYTSGLKCNPLYQPTPCIWLFLSRHNLPIPRMVPLAVFLGIAVGFGPRVGCGPPVTGLSVLTGPSVLGFSVTGLCVGGFPPWHAGLQLFGQACFTLSTKQCPIFFHASQSSYVSLHTRSHPGARHDSLQFSLT